MGDGANKFGGNGIFAVYQCESKTYWYSAGLKEIFAVMGEEQSIWEALADCRALAMEDRTRLENVVAELSVCPQRTSYDTEFELSNPQGNTVRYHVAFVCSKPQKEIVITFFKLRAATQDGTGMAENAGEENAEPFGEQEITKSMHRALKEEQFVVYYQPQYNHTTGLLVGAEALVRWQHPKRGLISPIQFIPVFEKNGFITQLDGYVFEKVCVFLKKCMDENISVVPVSVNLARFDIYSQEFVDKLEAVRQKYEVPSKYIRVEITESSALGNSRFISETVKKLHDYGYIVEMDDFGSGYSSLNILKDIDFDVIKLDMKFLQQENAHGNRGGTILSSIVRMMNWLRLPTIAEGVETVTQADFLRSIGCEYIQGYLYAKPMPEEDFKKMLQGSHIGSTASGMQLIESMDINNFWSDESLETLIFSNYVGGAAIFDYKDGKVEILRVNRKYLQELGMNLTEKDVLSGSPLDFMEPSESKKFLAALEEAVITGEEQECETWRVITSACCGEEKLCIRTTLRMLGRSKGNFLFYGMIRNVTAEKNQYSSILDNERRFKMASEQVNIYYWEYTVATREMRPCFRCMRDLGLPPLLTNYPDSAIEMGIFPPEVADMYRDWHVQIANGVKNLEAIIPLTADRVPFHVRYTTEFDENEHAVKAYGSAALVV